MLLPNLNPQPVSEPSPSIAVLAAERILSLKRPDETDAELARRVGLSPQQIANYRAGSGASLDAIAAVLTNTDANPWWLVLGEGPQQFPASERGDRLVRRGAEDALREIRACLAQVEQRLVGESRESEDST
jgi:hypothetical protein